MAKLQARDRIIWSADEKTVKAVGEGVQAMKGLQCVKLDRAFLEPRGLWNIRKVQEDFGVKVFDDAKLTEIPTKLVENALNHLKYRPWMLNCMAGNVSTRDLENPKTLDGLKRFADVCHEYGTLPCAVTVLTSKSKKVVKQEFGRTSKDQVLWYVSLLLESGFTDVVCSPREAKAIRKVKAYKILDLDTPGIVLAGGDPKDQARTDTPTGALKARADRLVIGRALTVGDRAENFKRILAEVELALAA